MSILASNEAAPHAETSAFGDALPVRFRPRRRTLPEILQEQAELYRERRLAVFDDIAWTSREGLEFSGRAGALLVSAGVGPGDRAANFCSNSPELLAMFLGCAWISAILVPINTASRGEQLMSCSRRFHCSIPMR